MQAALVAVVVASCAVGCVAEDENPTLPGPGASPSPEMIGAFCNTICADAADCGWFGVSDGGVCRKRCSAEVFRYRWEYVEEWRKCISQFIPGDCVHEAACPEAAARDLDELAHHDEYQAACVANACPCAVSDLAIYSTDTTEELIQCLDLACAELSSCVASATASF